jgi:hypothetical protein
MKCRISASTLGNEMQQQSALRRSAGDVRPATTSLVGIVRIRGHRLPVLDQANRPTLLDGPLGQALIAKLPEKGLVAGLLGSRFAAKQPAPDREAEDLDG